MKQQLIRLLRWLLDWLDPPSGELAAQARVYIAEAEGLHGTSGEYKRHVVYARLQKEFPRIPKRRLSLVIEQVLNVSG